MPNPTTPILPSSTLFLGETYTIQLPRENSGYTHNMFMVVDVATVIDRINGAEDSAEWTIPKTSTVLNAFATNSATKSATLYCTTYDSLGEMVGTITVGFTLQIPNTAEFAPTLTSTIMMPEGTGDYMSPIGSIYWEYAVSTKNGASRGPLKLKVGTDTFTLVSPSSSGHWTTPNLSVAGTFTPTATFTDSRGLSTTITLTQITVYAYSQPQINPHSGDNVVYVRRVDDQGDEARDGEYVRVRFSRRFTKTPLGNTGCSVTYKIAENVNPRVWSTPITLIPTSETENPVSYDNFGSVNIDPYGLGIELADFYADPSKNYIVALTATDSLGNETESTFNVPAEGVTLHLANDGYGVGVGRYARGWDSSAYNGRLDVAYDTHLHGDLYFGDEPYVISGTNNGWSYRKYADGKVEAHRVITYDQQYAFGSGGAVVRTGWHLYKCPDLGNNGEETISLPSVNGVPLFSATPAISVDADHLMIVVITEASNTEIKYYLATEGVEGAYPPSGQEITVHFYCTL